MESIRSGMPSLLVADGIDWACLEISLVPRTLEVRTKKQCDRSLEDWARHETAVEKSLSDR